MNALLAFEWPISETVVERLGWVLLHSLWQFALVALSAGIAVRAMRRSTAAARYGLLVVAMAVSVSLPVATWILQPGDVSDRADRRGASVPNQEEFALIGSAMGTPPHADDPTLATDPTVEFPDPDVAASEALPAARADVQRAPSWSERATSVLRPWLAWLVTGWSLGVVLCALRPLLGWQTLRRLRRVGVSPAPDDVLAAMRRVAARLGLRHAVKVLQSSLAQVPVVVGYLRPVILLPISLLTNMPGGQLEAILAHELAHVRRHDFLINLLQTLVETLFFYHPAVWWMSRRIRVEREHCCDDLVVSLLGNRVEYGRALLAIEQLRGHNLVLALSATDGSLLSRVRRIVGIKSDRTTVRMSDRWPVALVSVACLGVAIVLSVSLSLAAKDDAPKELQPAIAKLPGDISGEIIECDIIDAVTGKLISNTTTSFRFIKPKSADSEETTVAHIIWGPKGTGRISFGIPAQVMQRADREEIEVQWGTGNHPDYENHSPVERIPLKQFFHGEPRSARNTLRTIKLTPKKSGKKSDEGGVKADSPTIANRAGHADQAGKKYQSATYLQKILTAKIPDDLWGKARDGLRLAVVVRDVDNTEWNDLPAETRIPRSIKVQPGDEVRCQLVVENGSEHDIDISAYTYTEIGRSIEVRNRAGAKADVQSIPLLIPASPTFWRLRPGERFLLQMPPIHFVDMQRDKGIGYFVQTAPGEYTLHCDYTFGDGNGKAGGPISGKLEWTGTLTTGALKVTVSDPSGSDEQVLQNQPGGNNFGFQPAVEAIAANGEIVGRLLDAATGQPVEGATIACGAIINDSGKGGGANAVTDARGHYRLPVPSPGIYNIWLKKFDKAPSMTAAADDGILVESGKVATSQLRLVTGRKVSGQAVDSDGKPFENLTVSCYSAARPHSGGVQSSKTKADGSFEFSLPPGRAYIYASEQVKQTRDNPFGTGRSAHAHLQVPATGNVSPLKLTLQKTETKFGDPEWLNRSTPGTRIVRREGNQDVTGTVVDEAGTPIAGARVFREDGPIVLTNDKGEFRMETMKGTQFVMHAFAPGCHVWFGTPTSGDVLRIVIEHKRLPRAGREEPNNSGTLPRIRNWTAILVDGMTETPLKGISVQAHSAKENEKEPRLMSFKSDASGRIEVPLADGTGTTLQVTAAGWWAGNWPFVGYFPQAEGAKASQTAGDSTKPVTIKLWKGTHVTGKLMSPDGKPASGVALNAGVYLNNQEWKRRLGMSLTHYSWDHGDWPNWNAQVVTTADGTFEATVPLPDARGWVRVGTTQLGFGPIAPAGLDAVGPGKGLFQFAPFETEVGGLRAAQLPEEDGQLDLGTLQLERGIVLKGRVLDADGQPLTGVTLLTSGKRGPYAGRSAVSGENGRFEFLPMNPGGLAVSADARLRNEKGDVRSRDVQAVFVPLEVTLPETGEAREIVVRAVPHVTVEFEWIDRRTKKGPVSFYGEFTVTGRVPREGTSPASWRGETEKIERDGRELLMMKIPASLTNATLNLPADSVVTASYADDQTQSGPGQVELGDMTIKRRRIIYGDEPKQAKPTASPLTPTENVDNSN